MGVVYRAEDQKLGRSVALKFLPPDLARDPAALARFRREAQAASALNHPNICTIYGVEECDGKPVIVMEYIEGESLEAALKRGPISPERAVTMAIQIAAALDAAHRKGIVHRDLKPGNVLVMDTRVKVLDFGLAKMDRAPALGFEPAHVTTEGAILGTLHYLSPEQVQGKPVEARSDIFAFGVLLYEMLSGRKAFDGPNAAHVMAAILTLEPAPLGPGTSQALDLALRRCLAKEPEERWQSARDLKAALEWLSPARSHKPDAPPAQPTPPAKRWVWPLALVAAVLLAGTSWYYGRADRGAAARPQRVAAEAPKTAAVIPSAEKTAPPRDVALKKIAPSVPPPAATPKPDRTTSIQTVGGMVTRLKLSPDGKRLAYVSNGHLWISGTDGAAPVQYDAAIGTPFWSPDGRYLAATSTKKVLRRFEVGTQNTTNIGVVDSNFSGAWSPDGTILIGLLHDGLYRAPADGGVMRRVTTVDTSRGETRHVALQFLPDGRRFLYVAGTSAAGQSTLYVGSLDSPERVAVMPAPSNAAFVERPGRQGEGYLVYVTNSILTARPFNWKTLEVSGEPSLLGESVTGDRAADADFSLANFSVAGNTIALQRTGRERDRIVVLNNWMSGLK